MQRPPHDARADGAPASDVSQAPSDSPAELEVRGPVHGDAAAMWELVRATGLDVNSPYAYLLVCDDFAATSVVAADDHGPVGFVAAYRPPTDPAAVFVWQVGVATRGQRRGLGRQLLTSTLARPANRDARYMTATVTPSNEASLALFRGLGRDLGVEVTENERFPAELFPGGSDAHEPEMGVRIGPLPTPTDV